MVPGGVVVGLHTCHEEGGHTLRLVPNGSLHQSCEAPLVPALQVQASKVIEQESHQRHVTCGDRTTELGFPGKWMMKRGPGETLVQGVGLWPWWLEVGVGRSGAGVQCSDLLVQPA